jgi:hypothetical protein
MPKQNVAKIMETAASQPMLTPWRHGDGEGRQYEKDWRVIEPFIDDMPMPPCNVRLSDLQVFKIITNTKITQKERSENWPRDFDPRGGIRPERPPTSPTIHVTKGSKRYFLIFGEYYILCGTPCVPLKGWLTGSWTNGAWRSKLRLSFGLVEVPTIAEFDSAFIIDADTTDSCVIYKAPENGPLDWEHELSKMKTIHLIHKPPTIRTSSALKHQTVTVKRIVSDKTYILHTYKGQKKDATTKTLPDSQDTKTLSNNQDTRTLPDSQDTKTLSNNQDTRTLPDSQVTETLSNNQDTRTLPDNQDTRTLSNNQNTGTLRDNQVTRTVRDNQGAADTPSHTRSTASVDLEAFQKAYFDRKYKRNRTHDEENDGQNKHHAWVQTTTQLITSTMHTVKMIIEANQTDDDGVHEVSKVLQDALDSFK